MYEMSISMVEARLRYTEVAGTTAEGRVIQ
jgi:hypothetical protein